MRYIDLDEVRERLPNGWEERARRALEAVRDAGGGSQVIAQYAQVWRNLKDVLSTVSHDKCWYCEIKQTRSDNPVDHFRPKGAHEGEHEGYWWLAFDLANMRFSCGYCNSPHRDKVTDTLGGKWNAFPLFNPDERARRPEDPLAAERVILLDPTVAVDPMHLWFDPSGEVAPRYSEDSDPRRHRRAEESIQLYNLNYRKTTKDRRDLFRKIKKKVARGDSLFECTDTDDDSLSDLAQELLDLIKPSAQFSAAARAFLLGYRDRPWVEGILAAA